MFSRGVVGWRNSIGVAAVRPRRRETGGRRTVFSTRGARREGCDYAVCGVVFWPTVSVGLGVPRRFLENFIYLQHG